MEEIKKLIIIPATFAGNEGDNHRIFNCYIGENNDGEPIVQKRKFEAYSTEGIENPTYLFIGIMQGPGYVRLNFTDAKDFEDLFIEKWGCLVLTADLSD